MAHFFFFCLFFSSRTSTKFNFHMKFSRIALIITLMIFNLHWRSPYTRWIQAVYKFSFIQHVFIWMVRILFLFARTTSDHPSIDGFIITLFPFNFPLPFFSFGVHEYTSFFLLFFCFAGAICSFCVSIYFTVVICSMAIKKKLASEILRGLLAVYSIETCLCS